MKFVLPLALVLSLAMTSLGQRFRIRNPGMKVRGLISACKPSSISSAWSTPTCREYHRRFGFASARRRARAGGWWTGRMPMITSPLGVGRLTRIDTGDPRHFRLTDDQLVRLPLDLRHPDRLVGPDRCRNRAPARVPAARRIPGGGRFLGRRSSGRSSAETMERVLPGQPITDIAESDSVMHVLYDIREKDRTFIPGTRHLRRGPGGTVIVHATRGHAPRGAPCMTTAAAWWWR